MKRTIALLFGASLASMAGVAWAGNDIVQQPLKPVMVQPQAELPLATWDNPLGDCTPPTDLATCDALHALIRKEFSVTEIGMLFGPATSRAEYLTTYDRAHAHYARFLRDYEAGYYRVALVAK